MEILLQRTTKELSETVKAVIEAKVGDLSPAGVQSLEEFAKKVQTAMGQLDNTTPSCGVGAVQIQPAVAVSPVPVEVPGSPFALSGAASVSQISEVPTAFGGLRSVVSKDGGPTTSAKPGKELSKDHGRGFSGYPTLKAHTIFLLEILGGSNC